MGIVRCGGVAVVVMIGLLASGCGGKAKTPEQINTWSGMRCATGTCSISGQAYVTSEDGQVVNCADRPVRLVPVNNDTKPWIVNMIDDSEGDDAEETFRDDAPDGVEDIMRSVNGSPDGSFAFNNIPMGEYYVVFIVESKSAPPAAVSKVRVSAGEQVSGLVVTRQDRHD